MPTSSTPPKSNPLVIICVPTMMSYSRRAKSDTTASSARSEVSASRSRRTTRAAGKSRAISSSTFSVPKPIGSGAAASHAGQRGGTGSVWPQ